MTSDMCQRAGGRFWLGLWVSIALVILIPIGAVLLAQAEVRAAAEARVEKSKRDKPMRIDRQAGSALAYAVLSWKVQNGALPQPEAGGAMLQDVVRSFQERPVQGDNEDSDMFKDVKVLAYAPLESQGFSITLAWPEAPGKRTFVFDAKGNEVDRKESTDA